MLLNIGCNKRLFLFLFFSFAPVFNSGFFIIKPALGAAAPVPVSAAPKIRRVKIKKNGYVSLNFRNVGLPTLIKFFSKTTGKNFIYSGKLTGHITIISSKKITIEEAYKAFLTALSYKGYAVVKSRGLYKIIPTVAARQNPISVSGKILSATGHEYETQIVFLKYLNAQSIVQVLVPLLSPSANVQSFAPTNSLIITDFASNILKADKIIKDLDVPDYGQDITIYPVRYVSVTKIAKILNIIYTGTYSPSYVNAGINSQFVKIIPYKPANSLVIMATPQNMGKIVKLIKSLDIKSGAQNITIHVYNLKYAKAKTIASILTNVVSKSKKMNKNSSAVSGRPPFPNTARAPAAAPAGGGVSLVGNAVIIPDKDNNSLVIEATDEQYRQLSAVIKQLDRRRKQVFVQVVIAEIDLTKSSQIGAQYYGAKGNFFAGGNYNMAQGIATFLSNPFSLNGLVAGAAGGSMTLPIGPNGTMQTVPSFAALFQLISTNSAINVLSAPDILTLDNQKAKIMVGEDVPFITSSATSQFALQNIVTQVQRQNVGVSVDITPTINSNNYISLKIKGKITSIIPSPDGLNANLVGPTTSKRSIDTDVTVKNNQMVIIGGLIQNTVNNNTTGIPFLEDIPLLGYLFKDRQKSIEKDNLVMLISPKIVKTFGTIRKITNDKNRKFVNFENKTGQKLPGIKNFITVSPSFISKKVK
ncbi:MAG: type II secretion system secretin GspD [bacterium]